jgi:phospholipid transport system substrate-binding protein
MMATRRMVLAACLSVVAGGVVAGGGRPAFAAGQPDATIRALNAGLLGVMKAGKTVPFERRFAMLAPLIDQAFDMDALLRGAVGTRWAELPAADQEALRAEFRRFSIASWVANFDSFEGQSFSVAEAPRTLGGGALAVETKLNNPGGASVNLTYVMREGTDGWRAVDVLAEGSISRVAVLRSDFRAVLASGGAAALVARLRDKVATLGGGRAG